MNALRPARGVATTRHIFLAVLLALAFPLAVAAEQPPIDPRSIALTPADLPPGFSVVKDQVTDMPGALGVMLELHMQRPATEENLSSGPVFVAQIISRLDMPVDPADMLDEFRRILIEQQGWSPAPNGPNDRGRVSLVQRQGETTLWTYGFAKENFSIISMSSSRESAFGLQDLIALSGKSTVKLDAVLASRGGAPQPPASVANCAFVKASGPTIYKMEGGAKRAIPDWDTYLRLDGKPDLSNVCIISDTDLEAVPTGERLPSAK